MLIGMRGVATAILLCAGCGLFPSLDGLSGGDASIDGATNDATKSDAQSHQDGGGDGAVTYRATVLADKPVGYWRLGGTTSIAADELGLHPGSTHGNVEYGVPGAIINDPDTAAHFVDRTGWIQVPGPFQFTGTVPFSIEVWANSDTITDYFPLASCDGPLNTGPKYGWSFYFDLDGTLDFGRYDPDAGGKSIAATPTAPSTGAWHHYVATVDAVSEKIYVDGIFSDSAPSGNAAATPDDFTIGADTQGTGVAFQGVLDEVAIYDVTLSAAQVKHHYDVGHGP
jgi:hypothetical protein